MLINVQKRFSSRYSRGMLSEKVGTRGKMATINKWNINHEEGTIVVQICKIANYLYIVLSLRKFETLATAWGVYVEGNNRNVIESVGYWNMI